MPEQLRQRATAIIIKDNKILLLRRVKPNAVYYVVPGGGVEEGETIERALNREVMEELSLEVKKSHFLFSIKNIVIPDKFEPSNHGIQDIQVFSIDDFSGTPAIGGPEKDEMTEEDQYIPEWVKLEELKSMEYVYPVAVIKQLLNML